MTRTFAFIALAAVSVPSIAAAEGREVVVTISKADLALSDRQFRRKIGRAVEEVCGSYAAVESYQWPEIDDCRKNAWSGVRQQLADLKVQQQVKLGAR